MHVIHYNSRNKWTYLIIIIKSEMLQFNMLQLKEYLDKSLLIMFS